MRRQNRIITKSTFAAVLLIYPLLRGVSPLAYYAGFFPLGERPAELLLGLAAAVLYLSLLYLAWTLTDQVRFAVRHPAGRLVRRLGGAVLTAFWIALVEELLFRAMLLNELLEQWPAPAALAVGVAAFAGAHYVRSVKRYWTFPGHVVLGLLFCMAFYLTGTLWLPIGLHAGGVLVLMSVRPFIRYVGPAWLVGASIFPYAGVAGVVALGLLLTNLWLRFGANG